MGLYSGTILQVQPTIGQNLSPRESLVGTPAATRAESITDEGPRQYLRSSQTSVLNKNDLLDNSQMGIKVIFFSVRIDNNNQIGSELLQSLAERVRKRWWVEYTDLKHQNLAESN